MPNYGTTKNVEDFNNPKESTGGSVRVRKGEESLIFIHNPKTAGSSISYWLNDLIYSGYTYEKLNVHYTLKRTRQIWSEPATTFCVVRNPFSRYVSFWSYDMKANVEEETDFRTWFWNHHRKIPLQENYYVGCDIILKYESLEEDFKQIQEKVNSFFPLNRINVSQDYRTKHHSSYYDEEMYQRVMEINRETIKNFGYDFKD